MEDSAAEPVTTPIHENEESSNEKLQQKIERLTLLLKKAKESILDYTSQIRELEFELKQKDEELSSLKSKFTSISKYKPPKSESITEIITRVKVSEEVYCFINSKRGHFWIHESQLTSKHVLPEIIDSKLNKKHINDLITSSTQEWKEKCSKLTDQLCMNEENTENLRKMVQELNKQNENMEKQLRVLKENNIEKLLKTCFALYEDISEIVVQDNINNPKISSLQISFNDLNEGFNDPETIKIKENFLVILRYLMDLAKRLIYARNELKAQDSAWRSACDGLVKEKEELKNSLNKVKGESLNKNSELNEFVEKVKKDAQVEIEKLNNEIREKDEEILRSINAGYVKQVLLQFLMTNDSQVQDRMLSVLATLLNFSFEESQKLKDRKSSKGMFSKLLYN